MMLPQLYTDTGRHTNPLPDTGNRHTHQHYDTDRHKALVQTYKLAHINMNSQPETHKYTHRATYEHTHKQTQKHINTQTTHGLIITPGLLTRALNRVHHRVQRGLCSCGRTAPLSVKWGAWL